MGSNFLHSTKLEKTRYFRWFFLQSTLNYNSYMLRLYGLKQASRQWNAKLCEALVKLRVQTKWVWPLTVYQKTPEGITIILIYVDDMLITGDSLKIVEETKGKLKQAFKMKDLGELRYFLGIEFARSEHGILMHQRYSLRNSSQKLDSVVLSQQ